MYKHINIYLYVKRRLYMEITINYSVKDLASILNLLGDEIRLQIVLFLMEKDSCVCDVTSHLQISQPLASHHLRILRDAKIISPKKMGKHIFYSLSDENVRNMINSILLSGGNNNARN